MQKNEIIFSNIKNACCKLEKKLNLHLKIKCKCMKHRCCIFMDYQNGSHLAALCQQPCPQCQQNKIIGHQLQEVGSSACSSCINGDGIEMTMSFQFLHVNITNNLSWSNHLCHRQKHLYFPRSARKFSMPPMTLPNFYRCTIVAFYPILSPSTLILF